MESLPKGKVLITGITGFLGSHVCKLFLEKGYNVRGTVRSKKDEKKMKALQVLPNLDKLEIVEADLLKPESWDSAVAGCNLVAHVASPFPVATPKDENLLIKPAVQGTLCVLKACAAHKEVKAVVITSSIAAIQNLAKGAKDVYTEVDWPDLVACPPYGKSKTLAERAAWEFYDSLDKSTRFKLSVINPGFILGPSLIATDFTSGETIRLLLTGEAPTLPRVNWPIVDVRDVAMGHLLALENPISDHERYICTSDENLWFEEIAEILKGEFQKHGYNVTNTKHKYCSIRLVAMFNEAAKSILPFWGKNHKFKNDKIKSHLKMTFIPAKESVLQMAYSLIKYGIIPDKIKKK